MKTIILATAVALGAGSTAAPELPKLKSSKVNGIEQVGKSFPFLQFGKAIFMVEVDGKPLFQKVMKQQVGAAYGWAIQVDSEFRVLPIKEVLTLPAPSPSWTIGKYTNVLEGGKVAVTEGPMPIQDGLISNSWTLSPGDPKGEYKIEVFYKENLLYSTIFLVE